MRGFDAFMLALHIVTVALLLALLSGHQFVDMTLYKSAVKDLAADKYVDAVSLANELGRLDLVSALLAIVAFLVAIAGIVGYTEIRSRATREAREAALEYMQQNLGPMVRREAERVKDFEVSAGDMTENEAEALKNALGAKGGGE